MRTLFSIDQHLIAGAAGGRGAAATPCVATLSAIHDASMRSDVFDDESLASTNSV
jgi:hypothetical protein